MRNARCWVAFAVVLFGVSAALAFGPAAKEAKKPKAAAGDDAKEIEGTWTMVGVRIAIVGVPYPVPEDKPGPSAIALVIGGGKMTAFHGPSPGQASKYRLDAGTSPKSIDVVASEGRAQGIYWLRGDLLTMCFAAEPGAPRPTKFESDPHGKAFLFTLKRQSREWKHPAPAKPDVKEKEKAAAESNAPKLVKVSGTVKFKDGTVIPVPEEGKGSPPRILFTPVREPTSGRFFKGAVAVIRADGTFELTTIRPGDGAVSGKHVVSIIAPATDPPDGTFLVPKKYTSPRTSSLEVTIEKPTSDLRIVLDKE